jgi:hypothetical protein
MDAVGIERCQGITALLLVLVGDRAKPERRVVNPFWRIELASNEGERIKGAGRERGANMVRALHQAIFVADAGIEQHAMDKLRALVEIEHVLIADLDRQLARPNECRHVRLAPLERLSVGVHLGFAQAPDDALRQHGFNEEILLQHKPVALGRAQGAEDLVAPVAASGPECSSPIRARRARMDGSTAR